MDDGIADDATGRSASRPEDEAILLGLLQAHPSIVLTEMAGLGGYGFVLFDMEHGLYSLPDIQLGLLALSTTQTHGFVRLPPGGEHQIGSLLDLGVRGIVAPGVETAAQAEALARAMHYPPDGSRGAGASLHRGARFGFEGSAPAAPPELFVIIESRGGVRNATAILEVDGVDGVFVGPADLALDLGCPQAFTDPRVVEAISAIEAAALASGKRLAGPAPSARSIEAMSSYGYSLAVLDSDVGLLRRAMTAQLAEARRQIRAAAL